MSQPHVESEGSAAPAGHALTAPAAGPVSGPDAARRTDAVAAPGAVVDRTGDRTAHFAVDGPGSNPAVPQAVSDPGVSNPAVSDQGVPDPGAPSRTRRVMAAAASGRDKAIRQFVALLVPVIRATRYPLLAVVLVPVVPAVLVIVIALARPGPDDWFWVVLAAFGLGVGGWLALRRRQLLAVAADPEVLTTALTSMVTGRELWSQLIDNLSAGKVGAAVVRRSRPLRLLGGLWRGVRAAGVVAEFAASDELAPLTPLRLRGIWFLVLSCLLAGAVLGVAVLVAALLFLLGA